MNYRNIACPAFAGEQLPNAEGYGAEYSQQAQSFSPGRSQGTCQSRREVKPGRYFKWPWRSFKKLRTPTSLLQMALFDTEAKARRQVILNDLYIYIYLYLDRFLSLSLSLSLQSFLVFWGPIPDSFDKNTPQHGFLDHGKYSRLYSEGLFQ